MLDKEIQIRKQIKRRKFFSSTGKGIVALLFFKMLPFKLLSNQNKIKNTIKVSKPMKIQIHPAAVQRKSRG